MAGRHKVVALPLARALLEADDRALVSPPLGAQGVPLQHPGGVIVPGPQSPPPRRTAGVGDGAAVDRQRGLGRTLVQQSSLGNRVQVGGARRLHRSAPRHRRGASCGAAARRRGVLALFRREIIIEPLLRLKGVGVAGTAACHRLRVASPEVLQRLGWRNDGGCAWIHTSTPTSSQGRRRWRPRSQDDVMVAPYEFYPWPRPAHGMSRVLVKLCNARGQLPQGASGEIGWRQAGWSNFRNGAKSALLSPRGAVKVSHTSPFENTKSDPATHPRWSSREHGHQRG